MENTDWFTGNFKKVLKYIEILEVYCFMKFVKLYVYIFFPNLSLNVCDYRVLGHTVFLGFWSSRVRYYQKWYLSLKYPYCTAGEMTQQLSTLLSEVPGLVASTTWLLKTTCNSSSRAPDALFWSPQAHAYICTWRIAAHAYA